jgi:hypothetical protein
LEAFEAVLAAEAVLPPATGAGAATRFGAEPESVSTRESCLDMAPPPELFRFRDNKLLEADDENTESLFTISGQI